MLNGSLVRPAHILLPLLLLISAFAIAGDVNELLETSPDAETASTPAVPALEISIISPLQNQQISNSGIVLAVISPAGQVTSAWFEIGSFSSQLSAANNFSSEFDSLQLPNGSYTFTIHACAEENCPEKSIPVEIANADAVTPPEETATAQQENQTAANTGTTDNETAPFEEPPAASTAGILDENIIAGETPDVSDEQIIPDENQNLPEQPIEEIEEPEQISAAVIVKGSNISSALTLFDLNGGVAGSGTGEVSIEPNTYAARVDFFNSTFFRIDLEGVEIDTNSDFFEIDESIDTNNIGIPAEIAVVKVVAINPLVGFAGGTIEFNVPETATTLFKCRNWALAERICNGNWEIAMETVAGRIQVPISPSDPAFAFGKKAPSLISFDRLIECPKCGQHKVSPLTTVEMTISANASQEVVDGVLEDYFPAEWTLVLENGGIVSDVNTEFKKISWAVGTFTGELSRTYQIFSPQRTTPPTDYYFFTTLDTENSGYWAVKVADPATDVNLTVGGCSGGTLITSCPGLNTLGSAQDVVNNKSTNFNAGMNDGSYTDSINSVTFYVNHSGESTIDGAVAYTLENNAGTDYCAQDTTIQNNPATFVLDSNPGCTPTGGWTVAKLDDLNVLIRNTDNGQGQAAHYDYITIVVNYNPNGTLSFDFNIPPSDDNSSIFQDETFLVQGRTYCNTNNCGAVDTNVQYCAGASCSSFYDMNTDNTQPLYLSSGSNPRSSTLNAGQNYDVNWIVNGNTAGTYELRFSATGATADANTTSGTNRTMTIQAPAADYTFALAYPSSGCTEGKGRFPGQGNGSCQRGYFETTDLSGNADQNKVFPEGQQYGADGNVYFFVYDNQSTANNDINFTLDLNAALPSTLALKVAKDVNGWSGSGSCSGIDSNCVNVTTTSTNIGKAVFSTGQMDLNIWVFGDFIGAAVGNVDRNVTHTSGAT